MGILAERGIIPATSRRRETSRRACSSRWFAAACAAAVSRKSGDRPNSPRFAAFGTATSTRATRAQTCLPATAVPAWPFRRAICVERPSKVARARISGRRFPRLCIPRQISTPRRSVTYPSPPNSFRWQLCSRRRETVRIVNPLLIECARAHPDPGELRRLSGLCSDWDGLIKSAVRQGVAPLAFWALNRVCPDAVPPEALTALRNCFRQNIKQNFLYTKELFRLLDLFGLAGIQAIPFKGPALAWTLYETPGLRVVLVDLDLLVPQRDVSRALDLLTSSGYRRYSPSVGLRFFTDGGQLDLRRADGKFVIGLHWRLQIGRAHV